MSALIRSPRERAIQTLAFEGLGLVLVSPLLGWFAGTAAAESTRSLAVLSIAVMVWAAFYNTAFDHLEAHCAGHLASQRPHGLRVLHSVGLELTAALLTWPLIVGLTPLGWGEALLADVGLSLAYALYGYGFHLGFDRLRPLRRK